MKKIFIIAKGEFCRYFISPLAYVYLISFLLLNGSFALYFGRIFSSGNASLQAMFDFLPWIYLLFIPGISMRLWAEEFRSGTILQIMTLPVPISSFVWGKFLASWLFCTLALTLTFPFVITINILGSPDNGVIFNSYLGAFFLAGAMLAVSQTASALTKNQVIALVIAVLLNLLLFLSGLEYVLSFFRSFAPAYIIDMISSFSFLTHTYSFNLGLLELRDIIFFISLIIMFNLFTFLIISFKTSGTSGYLQSSSALGNLIAGFIIFCSFIGLNLFANNTLRQTRIDFTEEHLFTPSEATKTILKNLPSPVVAKVYYSPILGERDEQMRQSFDNLRLLLKTYQNLSKGKFTFRIYNPEPLSDIEDRAIHSGLQALPVPDTNTSAYFGIVFVNENGFSKPLPFLPLSRQKLLEQDLTETIYLLEHKKKTLGIITDSPIFGTNNGGVISQPWQIAEELNKYYEIKLIKTAEQLKNIDTLMIIHPQNMPSDLEKAIYEYSISGGKILAFFDIAAESLRLVGPQTTLSRQSNYGSLPEKWGFKFYQNATIADLDNSSQITINSADYSGVTQDLIQFYLTTDNFFQDIPITSKLNRMLLTSASVFTPLKDAPIYFIPLAMASKQSQLISATAVTQNLHPAEILRNFKADNMPKYIAAHIISQKKEKPFEIIVVGDSDLLYDSFWTTSTLIGETSYNIPLLDNANFVLNSLDYLSNNTSLHSLRGKSKKTRPFTSLEQEQKQILRLFKIKEKDIFDQITFIKKGLQEILNKKDFEGRQNFTPDELSIISKIKNNLEQKRRDLYTIRTELNKNLYTTELWVKFYNIYAIPLLLLLGITTFYIRHHKFNKPSSPKFNQRFWILCAISLTFVMLGGISILFIPEKNIPPYENTPLFPNLSEQINNVSEISLQNKNTTLSFMKENNIWTLKQHPEFFVNQNRIKSFLASLIQATIYEKKADKLENLPRFGLLPLNDTNSKTTIIKLKNSKEHTILSFETGDYNIELGRGAYGAYIKLPEQFQIWLAQINLIDLDMDYHNWTYSHLWNLQFGRFSSVNNNKNPDYIAKIASVLLNTKLNKPTTTPKTKPILSLDIKGEYFSNLTYNFYKQDNNFYIQFIFSDIAKNSALKFFAEKTKNNYYQITSSDMEKLINATKSIHGQ